MGLPSKRRGEGISVHTNGCPGGGKGGGTGEKPEYMKDSDAKLAEKLLINNSSKVTYSWRDWVIVETECSVVRKGLFTSQSAVWDWAKVTIIVSSGCSHLKHSSHFRALFLCSLDSFDTLDFRNFYRYLGDLSSLIHSKDFALNISARSMAERRRSARQLARIAAKDPEISPSILNSWTVVKLRQELKRRGYPTTGLKAELVIFCCTWIIYVYMLLFNKLRVSALALFKYLSFVSFPLYS